MAEVRVPNPLVEQFARGGVPRDLRLMAAQGVLPLNPADLAELVYLLLKDADAEVRAAAEATLRNVPVDEMAPILRDKATPAGILAWALAHREERPLRELVLQNTSLPDAAVRELAPHLPEAEAELVVINQVRLLRDTDLLVALESNPNLSADQKRRLRELRETFRIGEADPNAAPAPPPPAPPEAAAAVEAPAEPAAEDPFEPPAITEAEALERYLTEDERQKPEKVSAVQKIYKQNTADKVITALKGTREERNILIRDPNRIVSTAVLGSPKLTDAEVEAFAGMKNISDDILRKIGTNREWTKRYAVMSALVRNPRTPIGVSMSMVPRLNPRELKALGMDRNVSEAIRKHAQRFVKNQGEKQGGESK